MKILIGGSPCTHWSIAQTKNRETEASGIGWELFLNYRISRDKYKPDYFLYENNKSMSPAIRAQITKELGVEPVLINSALVSAQNRQRLYWAGKKNEDGTYSQVTIEQPTDCGILLRDILESGIVWREKGYALLSTTGGTTAEDMIARKQRNGVAKPVSIKPLTEKEMEYMVGDCGAYSDRWAYLQKPGQNEKATCLVANVHKGVQYNIMAEPVRIGTIENDANNQDFDSQQYRVYSQDGKSVTLCGNGGGLGAKTGLYATPVDAENIRCVAQRGRYIGENGSVAQHFEAREDEKTNTLTTVQKDNLIAVPIRVGDMPNAEGIIRGGKTKRIYDSDGKAVTLTARPNGGGVDGPMYAIPAGMAWRGRENGSSFEMRNDQKSNAVAATGHQSRLVIEAADGKQMPVYEVSNGQITIKGKQYPIKLADGFYIIRKPTVTECKRLQTVPDAYVFPVSDTQAYKMLGNGWTVDVIAHILNHFDGLTEEPVEVLSMYDGMSCGHIALDKLGAEITAYYATEIDKYAIQTTQHNFPDTVQLGDAFQVRNDDWHLPETTTAINKGGNTMQIKKSIYQETTWEELKEMAISGEAPKRLALHDEITITLEGSETATVEVAAYLPATEDKPAGVRFMFKDGLDEPHQMNEDWTNKGGYHASEGRRYILENIYTRLPADLRAVIRPRKITEITRGETLVYEDPLWLPSETDIFGRGSDSWQNGAADGPDDFQMPIYENERDRVKQRKGYGTTPYWCRSVYASNSSDFCRVDTDGAAYTYNANRSCALAPGFDI